MRAATAACRFPAPSGFSRRRRYPACGWAYRVAMRFPDSTLAALDLPIDEPLHWDRVLLIAIVVTLAAVSAALLI
jgi:hypothetical protein